MNDDPPTFFVALKFQIELEIVAGDDFVNNRVHFLGLCRIRSRIQLLRLQSSTEQRERRVSLVCGLHNRYA
jgi:hypothetical protein